jgi:hypothetical protein
MPLYFGYGSNMDAGTMARRCPASKPLGPARLVRHRFLVNTDGYATVARDPRCTVWGLLFDLALGDVPALDRYESLSTGLYSKLVQPVLSADRPKRALVYVGRSGKPGPPRPGYMEPVVAAARAIGAPAGYLRELESWLPVVRPDASPEPAAPRVRPIWSAPATARRRETL